MIPAPGRVQRILVVDDERANRTLLEVVLGAGGFEVECAAGGEEALQLIARHPPDLVLIDVNMPGLNGHGLTRILKSDAQTKGIPVILLTALHDRSARILGLSAGAEDFLTRPIDRTELCIRVRNLLRLKRGTDDAMAGRDASMGLVSHELRNALNGMLVNVALLAEDALATPATRQMLPGLRRVQAHGVAMQRLIGDLVDVAGFDAGKVVLHAEAGDVVSVMTDSLDAFVHVANARGIALAAAAGPPVSASFDRVRTMQVMTNLISNALKFTGPGGTVSLRCERMGDAVCLSVQDTGPGIPPDMLSAVFERFLQVGAGESAPDERGLGLGLFICKAIVEAQGGRIWVESRLGEGSTFCFTVLCAPTGTADRKGGRVLLVDDDRAMVETLAIWLRRRGFLVDSEVSAAAALTRFNVDDFDVVVSDLHMNDMNGVDFCRRLLVLRPSLPVILTSAFGTPQTREAALTAGAVDFLTKPFELDALQQALTSAVARAQRSAPVAHSST